MMSVLITIIACMAENSLREFGIEDEKGMFKKTREKNGQIQNNTPYRHLRKFDEIVMNATLQLSLIRLSNSLDYYLSDCNCWDVRNTA